MMKVTLTYLLLLSQLACSQPVCNVDECECTEPAPTGDNPCRDQSIGSSSLPVTFKEIKCEEPLSCQRRFEFFGNCANGEDCKISCKADAVDGEGSCEDGEFTVNGPGFLVEILCEGDDDVCDGTDFNVNNPGEGFKIICKDTGVDDACDDAVFVITIDSTNDVEEFGGIECIGQEACENAAITIINNNPDTIINLGTLRCIGLRACDGLDITFQGEGGVFFEKCECEGELACANFGGNQSAAACFSNPEGAIVDCRGGLCENVFLFGVSFKELNCEEPKSCFNSGFLLNCVEDCIINCVGDPDGEDGVCARSAFIVSGAIKEIKCEGDFACDGGESRATEFGIVNPAEGFKFICKGRRACYNTIQVMGFEMRNNSNDLIVDGIFCEEGFETCAKTKLIIANEAASSSLTVKEIKCDAGGNKDACDDLIIEVRDEGPVTIEKIECKEGDCDGCTIDFEIPNGFDGPCEDFGGESTVSAARAFTNRELDRGYERESSMNKDTQSVTFEIGTNSLAQIWALFVIIMIINCIACKYGACGTAYKYDVTVSKDTTFD